MSNGKMTNFFKVVTAKPGVTTMSDSQNIGDQGVYANYSYFQKLIQGSASRLTRYREYDLMDNDVEISRSLDTIAEEMTGQDPNSNLPLELVIDSTKVPNISSSVVFTLKAALRYWSEIHHWNNRLFKIARVTAKYGDCYFIRHKETTKWEYLHPKNVVGAIVDKHDMTRVLGWQIKREIKTPNSPYNQPTGQYGRPSDENVDTYAAQDIIWFSLNDDIGESAPFGESVLRAVYRAQKQKELLEDAIIIHRLVRAPEKRVYYVDVGKMPPQQVKAHLETFKNDMRQRRIPSQGGGVEQVDSVYNPQSMNEDIILATRPDGRGSKVENLASTASWSALEDLEYFQWKVFRGLRIPLSYMREGADNAQYNDGKTGVAYIQELRFAGYIKRLQGYMNVVIDSEFKRYLRTSGINVDTSAFNVKLPDPENFGIWRQHMLNTELVNTFSSTTSIKSLSPRFTMKKYLQLTDEEVISNERLRCQELGLNPDDMANNLQQIYGDVGEGGMGGLGGMGGGAPPMMAGSLGDEFGGEGETPEGGETPPEAGNEQPLL